MTETHDVIIVGAGQAGLCVSHELTILGREHVILERGKVGQSWRNRWVTFCLVLPNWTIRLSGQPYTGSDPDGFMRRDDFVGYLCAYADSFHAPVREGVAVWSLGSSQDGGFLVRTSSGDMTGADQLAKSLFVIDVDRYSNPGELPPGKVLVLGSGQSGCQIAEDLSKARRDVYLSCGRASWLPRRIGGRDAMTWLVDTPFMNTALSDLPSPMARLSANPQFSGRDGGHDLNYRTLRSMGVKLLGHFIGVKDGRALFAPDLAELIAFGDARYKEACDIIRNSASAKGVAPPEFPAPLPFVGADPPEFVELADFGAVIICSGFRPDYRSWIKFPEAFDNMGYPIQRDGSSTVVPGLHFMGVHFQRRRASATLLGVGEDAEVLARNMDAAMRQGRPRP
jgi:putative flavoprotein involved in K+ transport